MKELIIDEDFITLMIDKLYTLIPRNSILVFCLSILKSEPVTYKNYEISGITPNDKHIKQLSDGKMYERIAFIGNYSPLLCFYNFKGISYKPITNITIDTLYDKSEKLLELCLENNGLKNDSMFISLEDLLFYDYIKGIKDNNNCIKNKLYIIFNIKNIDPEYIPTYHLKEDVNILMRL